MTGVRDQERRSAILVVCAVALAFAVMEAAQAYLGFGLLGHDLTIADAFRLTLPSWLVLVALVPVVVWVADRATDVESVGTRAWIHLVAALMFAASHLAGSAALGELVLTRSPGFTQQFFQLASIYFVADLLTYGALVGLRGEVRRVRAEGDRRLAEARVDAGHAEAAANVLRAHLNPDFLFNTLNAVSGLVARGETQSGLDALSWLGRLVRTSTAQARGADPTLGGEIDRVDGYLRIQEIRFAERFKASIEVSSAAHAWRCPPLALYEGVVSLAEAGLARGDAVELTVSDDRQQAVHLSATYRSRTPPALDATPARQVARRLKELMGSDVSLQGRGSADQLRVEIGVLLSSAGG